MRSLKLIYETPLTMIIEDVNDQTPLKGQARPPSNEHHDFELEHKFRRKHLVAASVVLNCLLILLLTRTILRTRQSEHEPVVVPNGPSSPTERGDTRQEIHAVVPAPHLGRCTRGATWSNTTRLSAEDDFPFSTDASFELPNSSSLLFLLSQGALSGGRVNVVASSDSSPHVLLRMRYHSLEVRDRVCVCLMERKQANGSGIGIFTPSPFDGQNAKDKLDFSVTLLLPALLSQEGTGSLPVYNLETDLPSFAHDLDSLQGLLEFNTLVLRSSNQPIVAKSLFAANATIETSNGIISGSFDASSRLSLVTTNAPIDASVTLHHSNIFATTELVLQTRNAQLESAVSLATNTATGQGGRFDVKAVTSDGPLILSFPASPTHATLTLDAKTSNSPANVWLNHAYEGAFTLASSMVVVDRRPFFDPTKLRSVFYSDYQNGMVMGDVRWKLPIFRGKVRGSVHVATSNHILKLYV
ncbi:hypothetical protein B0H10DRAFT_1978829 [Mycena sp. CBHHK59/15]|nr:hypothetical protein B0H10DRAFT_1978829 [Mycena sp. CBHHK59/15]